MFSLDHFFMTLMGGNVEDTIYYGNTVASGSFVESNVADLSNTVATGLPASITAGGSNAHIGIIVPESMGVASFYMNGFKANTFVQVLDKIITTADGKRVDAKVYVSTYPYNSTVDIEIRNA